MIGAYAETAYTFVAAVAAPNACKYGWKSELLPAAPCNKDTAPPALVPFVIIRFALPGIVESLACKYAVAACKSTITAGALPMKLPSEALFVRPRVAGEATT